MATATVNGQLSVEGDLLALRELLAGVSLSGTHLRLYKSSFNPVAQNNSADFIAAEADFTGYAAEALTWGAVGIDNGGAPVALSDRALFQATDGVTPNTIGGCWIESDQTGPPAVHTAVQWFPFPNPIPVTTALAFIGVVVGMMLPGSTGYASVDY